jgi:hypothetical protein
MYRQESSRLPFSRVRPLPLLSSVSLALGCRTFLPTHANAHPARRQPVGTPDERDNLLDHTADHRLHAAFVLLATTECGAENAWVCAGLTST